MDIDVTALRAAAAERRQARRWQPVDARKATAAALLEGREPPRIVNDWHGPEFSAPSDLGGWLDDRLTERTWPRDPVTVAVFTLAEAMREGRDAAVAAVKLARGLTPLQQYLVFATLMVWRGRSFMPAEPVLSAVTGRWRHLGLATERPEDE